MAVHFSKRYENEGNTVPEETNNLSQLAPGYDSIAPPNINSLATLLVSQKIAKSPTLRLSINV